MRKELAVNIIFLEVNQNLYFSQSDIKYVDLLVCAKWLFNVKVYLIFFWVRIVPNLYDIYKGGVRKIKMEI